MTFPRSDLIYSTEAIRKAETIAQTELHFAATELMNQAGQSAFAWMKKKFSNAHNILIFCGSGNNGGDGYILASLCHQAKFKVLIYQVGNVNQLKNEAKFAYEAAKKLNIPMQTPEDCNFEGYDLIIDAICGIGLQGMIKPTVSTIINQINQSNLPILSLDIPTGLSSDTGAILGNAIVAHSTITFIAYKVGLLTNEGKNCSGELVLDDLNLPKTLLSRLKPSAQIIHFSQFNDYLKPRPKNWHKGLSGHVLLIGGNKGYGGAVRMAAEAALRTGAGLVSIATHPSHAAFLNLTRPEIMCHGISEEKELEPLIARANVIVIGPGLGQNDWAQTLFHQSLSTSLPLIIDADGLNLLAKNAIKKENWILTPHPAEAARLLNQTTAEVQKDRLSSAMSIQQKYGGHIILKGSGTIVLSSNELTGICDAGNPGMATAGMGDVLSGILGSLVGQKVPLAKAAKLGVLLHAKAADLAAQWGERGMLAQDLMPYLRQFINHYEKIPSK